MLSKLISILIPHAADRPILLPSFPRWAVRLLVIGVLLSWLPLALIAWARSTLSPRPRIHLIQDMDNQPRYKTQSASALFADGRSMRSPVPGAVARGRLDDDDHFSLGFRRVMDPASGQCKLEYQRGIPAQVRVNKALFERGQQQYNIYCAVCHGYDGYGNGMVNVRAERLETPGWVPPTSMHAQQVIDREDGHLYNTIRNGIRSMPAYGPQIEPRDRWAIVAYIRALQLSQNAPRESIPPEQMDRLR